MRLLLLIAFTCSLSLQAAEEIVSVPAEFRGVYNMTHFWEGVAGQEIPVLSLHHFTRTEPTDWRLDAIQVVMPGGVAVRFSTLLRLENGAILATVPGETLLFGPWAKKPGHTMFMIYADGTDQWVALLGIRQP